MLWVNAGERSPPSRAQSARATSSSSESIAARARCSRAARSRRARSARTRPSMHGYCAACVHELDVCVSRSALLVFVPFPYPCIPAWLVCSAAFLRCWMQRIQQLWLLACSLDVLTSIASYARIAHIHAYNAYYARIARIARICTHIACYARIMRV